MIVLLPGLFRDLPQPALAAIVITASLSLADIPGTVRLWHQRKTEFWLSIAAFLGVAILGVAILGVLPGIAVAVVLSILNIFRRAWWPYQTVLGRVPGLEGFHDVTVHPNARHLVGLEIYRFDAPLFFANVKTFRDNVRRLARQDPKPPRWILVAAEPITDVDTTAADVLFELDRELDAQARRWCSPSSRRRCGRRSTATAWPRPSSRRTSSAPSRRPSPPTSSTPASTGPPNPDSPPGFGPCRPMCRVPPARNGRVDAKMRSRTECEGSRHRCQRPR